MISSLRGTLANRTNEYVIVDVGGVGYKVSVSAGTLDSLGAVGETVTLMTHMHVREDILALYGFATEQERKMFELLLNVSGVGPKAAINILSAARLDALCTAITSGNTDILTRIPGIGAKTAGRIVLELKGKMDPQITATSSSVLASSDADVVDALTNLGYSVAQAQAAVRSLSADGGLSMEEKLVHALRYFAERSE